MFTLQSIQKDTFFLTATEDFVYYKVPGYIEKRQGDEVVWRCAYSPVYGMTHNKAFVTGGVLCLGNPDDGLTCIDIETGKIVDAQPDLGMYYSLVANQQKILTNDYREGVEKTSLYNILTHEIEWAKDGFRNPWPIYDEVFFDCVSNTDGMFYKLDFSSGKQLATINFKETIDEPREVVTKQLGVYQNHLYLVRNSISVDYNYCQLFEVAIDTFKIKRTWSNTLFEIPDAGPSLMLYKLSNFLLDAERGRLIGLVTDYSVSLDLATGEISYKSHKGYNTRNHLNELYSSSWCSLHKGILYSSSNAMLEKYPRELLTANIAFDLTSDELIWSHVYTEEGRSGIGGGNFPSVTDTHLYQMDVNDNLFTFKRL